MATTKVRKSRSTASMLVSAIRSPFDKALEGVKLFIHLVLKLISLDELATLAGDNVKCQELAEYARELIRGVKRDLSVSLLAKIGLIEEVKDGPHPEGGKVFRVLTLVDWTTALGEYILSCCPQTGRDWDIFKTIEQYLTERKGHSLETTHLVWFGKGVSKTTAQAAEWLTAAKIEWAWVHPRIPLSIIGSASSIFGQLKAHGYCCDSVGIVTGAECTLDGGSYVPDAWQYFGDKRSANLNHVSTEWNDSYLFAFSRQPASRQASI